MPSQNASASDSELNKENQNLENVIQGASESSDRKNAPKASSSKGAGLQNAKQLLEKKDFRNVTDKR